MREDLVAARDDHIRRFHDAGLPLYPTWHGRTHRAADVHAHASELEGSGTEVTVAGRLLGRRGHGKSTFLDLYDQSGKMQLLFHEDRVGPDVYDRSNALDRGDILAVTGIVMRTKAGEVTIDASSWTLLAKSRAPLPDTWSGLQDIEKRARTRELDLLINEESRAVFETRSTLIRSLREFLVERSFVEVETPVLQPIPGGTSARPFVTHHHALDMDLFLRISPELYLKRLVVGGMERVFEIARNFRNEGVDRHHNPEFTMCELYWAYATVEDLLPLTEELFTHLLTATRGTCSFPYQGKMISFETPWKQISFVEELHKETGIDVASEQDPQVYVQTMERMGLTIPAIHTLPALLDELYKQVLRKKIWDPVVVYDFPTIMEPLAKRQEGRPELVQRIQVLAAGMELIKAYTELNDPEDQEQRFIAQEELRASGDLDAQRIDQQFLTALRIGLPPTAGWGMGVDRLALIATDRSHIRDVIAFPLMRTDV